LVVLHSEQPKDDDDYYDDDEPSEDKVPTFQNPVAVLSFLTFCAAALEGNLDKLLPGFLEIPSSHKGTLIWKKGLMFSSKPCSPSGRRAIHPISLLQLRSQFYSVGQSRIRKVCAKYLHNK
jgi:hypothetical protein